MQTNDQIITILDQESITITPEENIENNIVLVHYGDSNCNILLKCDKPNTKINCSYIKIGEGSEKTKNSIEALLTNDELEVQVNTYNICTQSAKTGITGQITATIQASNSKAHLHQTSLIFGEKAHAVNTPVLDITGTTIEASHGCEIHKFKPEDLFYIQSRGANQEQINNLLISSTINNATAHLKNESRKKCLTDEIMTKLSQMTQKDE